MLKCLLLAAMFLQAPIALSASDEYLMYELEEANLESVGASLNVISRANALQMWNARDEARFLSQSEIARIAFAAFRKARDEGVQNPSDVSRAIGGMIRAYQGNDFELWRSKIGELYLLRGQGFDQDGFAGAIGNLLGAIDFGGIAAIIQQIIAIIQLFL
jgi:hypothetical protein